MKKIVKIILSVTLLASIFIFEACAGDVNYVYFYGVATYKKIGGETRLFAYVPIASCGEVRIFDDVEGVEEGDVLKMKFEGAPNVREVSENDEVYLMFLPVPTEVSSVVKGANITPTGSGYLLTLPKSVLDCSEDGATVINVYDGDGKKIATFSEVVFDAQTVGISVSESAGHRSLAMLEYTLKAEKN